MPRPTTGVRIAAEGGGYVASCECRWLRWLELESTARDVKREHLKKCKVARGENDE